MSHEDTEEVTFDLVKSRATFNELVNATESAAQRSLVTALETTFLYCHAQSAEPGCEELHNEIVAFVWERANAEGALPRELCRLVLSLGTYEVKVSDSRFGESKAILFDKVSKFLAETRGNGGIDNGRFRSFSVALSVLRAWFNCLRFRKASDIPLRMAEYVIALDDVFAVLQDLTKLPSLDEPFLLEAVHGGFKVVRALLNTSDTYEFFNASCSHASAAWVSLAEDFLDHPASQAASYPRAVAAALHVLRSVSAQLPAKKRKGGKHAKKAAANTELGLKLSLIHI